MVYSLMAMSAAFQPGEVQHRLGKKCRFRPVQGRTLSSGVVEMALLNGLADLKPKLIFNARVLNQLGKMTILSWFDRLTPMTQHSAPRKGECDV